MCHSDINKLAQVVPKRILPKEYGGEEPMADMISMKTLQQLFMPLYNFTCLIKNIVRMLETRTTSKTGQSHEAGSDENISKTCRKHRAEKQGPQIQ